MGGKANFFLTKTTKERIMSSFNILFTSCLFALFISACSTPNTTSKSGPLTRHSPDDGTQMLSPFRLNYAGYLPLQQKLAVYITKAKQPVQWVLKDKHHRAVAKGISKDRRADDHASGDNFFIIDFSKYQTEGLGYYLSIAGNDSAHFDISDDPYGDLKLEFFDFFKDHRRSGDVFDRQVDNWSEHSVTLNYVVDAGDKAGYYTVNAAEAQWHLINAFETYPEFNDYFHKQSSAMAKVYDELVFMSDPLHKVIFPGETLAVAKLHTHSNSTNMKCPGAPGDSGTCISKPETKATFAVARTLAAMARLHQHFGKNDLAHKDYKQAKKALNNAEQSPFVCLTWEGFGGEGGYYPNNDNWSLWRDPRSHRDPCASGPVADPKDNNISDDHYAALVEVFLSAKKLGYANDAQQLQKAVEQHPHHQRVDQFYWGAVSTEATLSLLTHRPKDMDLTGAEQNVLRYAQRVLAYQDIGYPGITFDTQSNTWDSNDEDNKDNNFRWGSNRMQLNDARILMEAAKLSYQGQQYQQAARYTNGVLRVMDQISGTNAVALAMYTAGDYPHIEHAITRTHDANVPDSESGKLVVGPNNWTNSNDPDMPPFGSQPGMKSFALQGTGWASREVYIDGNASLVVATYFLTEIAPDYLEAAAKNSVDKKVN